VKAAGRGPVACRRHLDRGLVVGERVALLALRHVPLHADEGHGALVLAAHLPHTTGDSDREGSERDRVKTREKRMHRTTLVTTGINDPINAPMSHLLEEHVARGDAFTFLGGHELLHLLRVAGEAHCTGDGSKMIR